MSTGNPFHSVEPSLRRSRRRWIAWLAGAGLIGTPLLYAFLTSGMFFKGVILPRVEHRLRARITVEKVEWSPWSQLALRGLRVRTTGDQPLIEADELRLQGSSWAWWRGEMKFGAITLARPAVHVVEEADGTSNLDPLLQALAPDASATGGGWSIEGITAHDGAITCIKNTAAGRALTLQADGLSFDVGPLENGQTSQWQITANAKASRDAQIAEGNLTANGTLSISSVGKLGRAAGKFAWLPAVVTAQPAVRGELDWTPGRLNQCVLDFSEGNIPSGQVKLSGGVEAAQGDDWVLQASARAVPGNVLRLLPLGRDVDFRGTQLHGTNTLRLSGSWTAPRVVAHGQWQALPLLISRAGVTTPAVEVTADYALHWDAAQKTFQIAQAHLSGVKEGRRLFQGRLTSPWQVMGATGSTQPLAGELVLQDMDVAQWRPLLADIADAGRLSLQLTTAPARGGVIQFTIGASALGLEAKQGDFTLRRSDLSLSATGEWSGSRIKIQQGGLRHLARAENNSQSHTQLENLELTFVRPVANQDWQLMIAADVQHQSGTNSVQGALRGSANCTGALLKMPVAADVNATFQAGNATGVFAEVAGIQTRLVGQWTTDRLQQLVLQLERGGAALGGLRARGDRDAADGAWRLDCVVDSVDRRLLNYIGAPWAMDFRGTMLNATNQVRIAADGRQWQVNGHADARQFSVARDGATTPPLEISADYDLAWDWQQRTCLLQKFALSGKQGARQILRGQLLQPLRLSQAGPAGASQMELSVQGLDLRDWQPLLGRHAQAGQFDAQLRLHARQAGQPMEFNGTMDARNLVAGSLRSAAVQLQINGRLAGWTGVLLDHYRAQWSGASGRSHVAEGAGQAEFAGADEVHLKKFTGEYRVGNLPAAQYALAGQYSTGTRAGRMAFAFTEVNQHALQSLSLWDRPDWPLRSAKGEANGTMVFNSEGAPEIRARVEFVGVPVEHVRWPQEPLGVAALVEGGLRRQENGGWEMQVSRMGGGWRWGDGEAERFEMEGAARLVGGQFDAGLTKCKLTNIGPATLRALGLAMAGDKTLQSGLLTADGSAQWDSRGSSGFSGKCSVTNLTLNDPAGLWNNRPLQAAWELEVLSQRLASGAHLVQVGKLDGTCSLGAGHNATFSVKGKHDSARHVGDWQIKVGGVDSEFLKPMLAPWFEMKNLASGMAALEQNTEVLANGKQHMSGTLSVRDWQWRAAKEANATRIAAKMEFELVADAKAQSLEVRRFHVDLPDTNGTKNDVEIAGSLDMSTPGKITGRLSAKSDALELERLLDFINALPHSPSPREAADLRWQLDAKRLLWANLVAENCTALEIQNGKALDFTDLRMRLEGGDVAGHYRINYSGPNVQHDIGLKGAGVAPLPLLLRWPTIKRHLPLAAQEWIGAQKDWGKLAGDIRLRWTDGAFQNGRITSKDHETDPAELHITHTQLRLPEGQNRAGLLTKVLLLPLTGAAKGMEVDKLLAELVRDVALSTRLEQGKLELSFVFNTGSFKTQTAGTIQLLTDVGQSVLDLPVGIALAPDVARKFRIGDGLFQRNEYYQLPLFLRLQGTLGNPDPVTDKAMLGIMLIRGLGANTTNVPFEILRKAPGMIVDPRKLPQLLDILPLPLRPWELLFPPPKK